MALNFRARFIASLDEIGDLVAEEKRHLTAEPKGDEEVTTAGNKTKSQQTDEKGSISGTGCGGGSSKYFRRCSSVLGIQVEVSAVP